MESGGYRKRINKYNHSRKPIKHLMLREAKRIASTHYEDRVSKVRNLGTLEWEEYITPALVQRNDEIKRTADEFKFDYEKLKEMVLTIKSSRKSDEFDYDEDDLLGECS